MKKQFQTILEENKERIYRLCKGFVGNSADVDDLYQEVLINIWKNLEKFRGDAKLSTWIYRITTNTALLYRKRDAKRKQLFPERDQAANLKIVASVNTLPEKREQEAKIQKLLDAITNLNKESRIIITMTLEGFSYQQIADIVGISPNYVGVKVNRIRKELAKKMNHHERIK